MATTKKTTKPTKNTVNKTKTAKSEPMKETHSLGKTNVAQNKLNSIMKNSMLSRKQVIILIVIGLVLGILYYGRTLFFVAMVNGKPITRWEVIQLLERQGGQGAVDAKISETLLYQYAQDNGIVVTEEDIDADIAKIEKQLEGSQQSLDELLKLQGYTMDRLRQETRLNIILEKALADKVEVTDEEVNTAFEAQADSLGDDVNEEEYKAQLRDGLKQQKYQFEAQNFIQDLQSQADIKYIKEY